MQIALLQEDQRKSLFLLSTQFLKRIFYRSLNRCIFYVLSRPVQTSQDQKRIESLLQSLIGNGDIFLLSEANRDPALTPCLIHLLLMQSKRIKQDVEASQEWPKRPSLVDAPEDEYFSSSLLGEDESEQTLVEDAQSLDKNVDREIKLLCERLWKLVYQHRRETINNLAPESPLALGMTVLELVDWASILESPCGAVWFPYVTLEASAIGGTAPEIVWGRYDARFFELTFLDQLQVLNDSAPDPVPPQNPVQIRMTPQQILSSTTATTPSGGSSSRFLSRMSNSVFRIGQQGEQLNRTHSQRQETLTAEEQLNQALFDRIQRISSEFKKLSQSSVNTGTSARLIVEVSDTFDCSISFSENPILRAATV
ncbi:hypothetical protein Ciccas_005789 [Cichlidogyrus casuarinus]|uniref:Uncharacterized protein n=1 Tax=Cichlidogyrus casuarinus TaxID=1844966 RepID=A0ABD2Q7Q4_9PLAT